MIKRIKEWYMQRKIFKKTYRELSQLSARELDDLGLDRSMITRVANEAAYSKGANHA